MFGLSVYFPFCLGCVDFNKHIPRVSTYVYDPLVFFICFQGIYLIDDCWYIVIEKVELCQLDKSDVSDAMVIER